MCAVTESALLFRRLLEEKRRIAFGTRFEDRPIPVNYITVWVLGAAVERLSALRFLDNQFAFATRPRTRNTDGLLLDVFTLWIIRTRNKLSETSETPHKLRAVHRTLFIERHRRGRCQPALLDLAYIATFRVTGAAKKRSKAASLHLHRLATQV